jgi:hypothetical protein
MRIENPRYTERLGSVRINGVQKVLELMSLSGLGAIYHSPPCGNDTSQLIVKELLQQDALNEGEEPPKPRLSSPLKKIELIKIQCNYGRADERVFCSGK